MSEPTVTSDQLPTPSCMNRRQALMAFAAAAALPMFGSKAYAELSDEEILLSADRARGGGLPGINWQVAVSAKANDGTTDDRVLDIWAVQGDWAAEFLQPNKIRGQRLVKRGQNLWFSKPDLSKPVPISKRQRLTGNASNGDIASTNYVADYTWQRLEDEMLDGIATHVFDLTAKDTSVTYDQIRYWVDAKHLVGLRADFSSAAGRLLKRAFFEYGNTVLFAGETRPFISRMLIEDMIDQGNLTLLSYSNITVAEVPFGKFDV